MLVLIDGHNLIPHMPGVDLSDIDDEARLIRMLQTYCRLRRKRVEVFFDRAPAGWTGRQQHGQVLAHFVPAGTTADAAIMTRLRNLGKRAKNVTVVSSDRQVIAAARAVHASVVAAEAFAAEWVGLTEQEPELDPRNRMLSEEEVAAWEQLFSKGHPPASKSH